MVRTRVKWFWRNDWPERLKCRTYWALDMDSRTWDLSFEIRRHWGRWTYVRRPDIDGKCVFINTSWIAVWLHWALPKWLWNRRYESVMAWLRGGNR